MLLNDDRTDEQRKTHTWLVIATDKFMSGWGKATGGKSYAVWACKPEDRLKVLAWVENRSDMKRVREVPEHGNARYRPSGIGHCHIYVITDAHPAI